MVSAARPLKRLLASRPGLYRAARRSKAVASYLARRPHEPDFRAFGTLAEDDRLFLDVGANIGQAAMSFRIFRREAPILSVEPNPELLGDLKLASRLVGNMETLTAAAGAEPGRATLHVPVHAGLELTGEASLSDRDASGVWWVRQQRIDPAEVETRTIDVEVLRLDDLGLAPGYVKVDIEGGELDCLTGLRETITGHRPVVMVERAAEWAPIADFFSELDYVEAAFDRVAGRLTRTVDPEGQNAFWLPGERADAALGG